MDMKIYTSYYGNLKELRSNGITPIGISIVTPNWYKGQMYKMVAPTYWMLRLESRDEYIKCYNRILARLDKDNVIRDIESISKGTDAALLCYEKPDEFCHRHLLADWLKDKVEIKEYVGYSVHSAAVQLDLF